VIDLAAVRAELALSGLPGDVTAALRSLADPEAGPEQAGPEQAGPEGQVAAVATAALDDLLRCRRPLEVELSVGAMLGMISNAAPEDADPAETAAAQGLLLAAMAEAWGATGGAAGLAGLRALAALGPQATRARAAGYAGRLTAAGVPEPRWGATIGRPEFVRAWQYGDVFGSQSSVGLLFDYGRREHALLVLIDHTLGGGVKDCFVVEGRAASGLRDTVRDRLEGEPASVFEDVGAAQAATSLSAALAVPPCPVEESQIEDVGNHLALLRSRTALLAELAGLPALADPLAEALRDGSGELVPEAVPASVLRVRVSLTGIEPAIWRRLELPSNLTLSRLHAVLQMAFDWDGMHLHSFERTPPAAVRQKMPGAGPERVSKVGERHIQIGQILREPGDEVLYRYDFGDDWEHLVVLESRADPEEGVGYPRCTGGERHAPPEDCGGAPGYEHLMQVLADPAHPGHADLLEWAPVGFDPAAFSARALDAGLARLR
jgi:hypothetical protein